MKKKIFIAVVFFMFLLLAMGGAYYNSYAVQDWAGIYLFPSSVLDAPKNIHSTPFLLDTIANPLHMIVIGDAGTGGPGQRSIAQSMAKIARRYPASGVLYLGDNFYESGVASVDDEQWKSKFEEMYADSALFIPFYAVLGNHDYRLNADAQIEYSRQNTRWKMPARYYTFTLPLQKTANVEFFCLETEYMAYRSSEELALKLDTNSYAPQLRWLENKLQRSKAKWKIVLAHHPLYSSGAHGSNPTLITLLEPLLVKYNVHLYLAGHDHHQELLRPIKGVHHLISGGASKHRDVQWNTNTLFASTNLGFVSLFLTRTTAYVVFYSREGNIEYMYAMHNYKTKN